MKPSGASTTSTSLHVPLIEERADRAEDLFEVLARTALVDPHRASLRLPRDGGPGQEPVVWSSSPRSLARRSLARKTAVAASVATVPVTSKATTISPAVGASCRPAIAEGDPGPPIPVGPPGNSAARTPSIHHVERRHEADGLDADRQDREREDRPADEEQRAGDRLRVRPRLLAGLEADRRERPRSRRSRRGRRAMTTTRSGQSIRVDVERDAERDDADAERDERARPTATRATPRPSSTTRKSLGLT